MQAVDDAVATAARQHDAALGSSEFDERTGADNNVIAIAAATSEERYRTSQCMQLFSRNIQNHVADVIAGCCNRFE